LTERPSGTSLFQEQLAGQQQASDELDQYSAQNRNNLLLPGEVDVKKLLPSSGEELPPPYGANLFAGGYESERADGLRDNYPVAAGDKINLWLWGAVNYSSVVTVDNQGNIFIPEVGPVQVKDIPAGELNRFVTQKIRTVYKNNVSVYVNLLTATPVSVFITGPVVRPGQYAGMASDSVLYFLKRAGGIDSERGSYREISIIRNNTKVYTIDLYQFVRFGSMPSVSFKDGDVILVEPQKPAVTVAGAARNPFRFELGELNANGQTLVGYAKPLSKVSHVAVVGSRNTGPISVYLPYQEFLSFKLADGDKVLFNDDAHPNIIDVQLQGSFKGPSHYTVKKGSRLNELLDHIAVDPILADIDAIYILRKSVAERQKQALTESLDRLERSIFTAPASSDGEAAIRAREAEMVLRFTDRARKVVPLGKVLVADSDTVANIMLEQDDQIIIPLQTDLVQVTGEVMMPQALVYSSSASLTDYINWAGGFAERADDDRVAVVRANGRIEFNAQAPIQPGDQIMVFPKVDSKIMQTVKDITQIVYQIAIAANVVSN
jgi:protein involved in polysaccharide export with SLBB domain